MQVQFTGTSFCSPPSFFLTPTGSRVGLQVPTKQFPAVVAAAARKYHPNSCGSENGDYFTKLFIQVGEAYRVLSDPVLREEYDSRLKNGYNPAVRNRRRRGEKVIEFGDWEAQLEGLQERSSDLKTRSSWASRRRSSAVAHTHE